MNTITVKDVMHRDVIKVPPSTTIEEAVALAQARHVGSIIVTENNLVVGIATTNDIFLGILNPLLGIGLPGARIVVINCFKGPDIERVLSAINKLKVGITNLFVSEFPQVGKHDLMIHLDTKDIPKVIEEIQKLGFSVVERNR